MPIISGHEWGFLATLAVVQEGGWRIHDLGADLPVEEMMDAAWKLRPRGVAFSASDPDLVRSTLPALAALPAKLPPNTMAVIGGGGAEPHVRARKPRGWKRFRIRQAEAAGNGPDDRGRDDHGSARSWWSWWCRC